MSASLLRIGHLRCVNKCLQTEGWKMLSRAPTALPFSTKSSGSKNSSKKTSKDKSKPKTYFDIEKLVQHKPCNFPKKEVSPAASAVTEAALEAIASAATKHTPPVASAGTIAAAADGTTQAVTASFVKEVPSNTATDESTVEVVPEAFPGEDALMLEASKVAAEPAVDVPQVPMHPASVESAPGPLVDVALVDGALNLVHEAGPNKAETPPAEGSLKSVVEAAPVVEVAPEEVPLEPLVEAAPVVEAAPEEVPLEPLVEAAPVVEAAPEEASLEPAVEAAPEEASLEPAVEAAPEEASLEPVVEAAPEEASLEPAVEAAPEEASLEPVVEAAPPEPSPKLATEASDRVPETLTVDLQAPLEPVAEATPSEPDPAESMPEPEAEVVLEPVAEITDATDVVPGSEDLVDPAWVLSKAAEEELQMDSPAEAVGPSQAHMDPVQRLFLDSIREYSANSQAAGGLVDADPLYQKVLEEETAKLQRLYGGGDLTSFPNFKFTEPQWDEGSQK